MVAEAWEYDEQRKIWWGPPRVDNSNEVDYQKSFGEQLLSKMQINAERICQISDTENISLTHGEVLQYGISIANFIRSHNFTHNDVVGLIAKNSAFVLPIAIGCWLNCTPLHPIYNQSDKSVISHLFGMTRPKIIFCDAADYEQLSLALEDLKLKSLVLIIDDEIAEVQRLHEIFKNHTEINNFVPSKLVLGPAQTMLYMCSSGTTGFPKTMHFSNQQILRLYNIGDQKEVLFSFSNLNWITGLIIVVNTLLSGSTRIITSTGTNAEVAYNLIEKYKISMMVTTPSQLAQIVKSYSDGDRNIKSLKLLMCGGGIVPVPIIEQTLKILNKQQILTILYGASEWGITSTNKNFNKPKSAGKLLPGYSVKVVNEDGKELGIGEVGEFLIQNSTDWHGYLHNEAETAGMLDKQGWFHTGDLGYFDEDAYLYIVDRKKDVMKYRGVDYRPSEIEGCIAELSDVVESCVFSSYDAVDMDRATAAVIVKNGSQLSELDIREHVAKRLQERMHLHGGVYIVDSLPKTTTGKNVRRKAKEMIKALRTHKNSDV
ncbi:luciferin 4-monooxygenase-like [Teleopsis dalmanni]|uniref:luciferin 4-monooxygenase-like n=1 Tax=Teleopsis dalmanni TaxID=139649 RepID=UPI0018CE3FBA|nr:luciferin 4-monooxygenase-like [Teleopsis dalmanni]XP_037949703.1 luciferin 4-monooxygenase-like [Teleopsis dalmanni]